MKTNLMILLCMIFTLSVNAQSQADISKYMEMMGGGMVSISDYPDLEDVKPSSFDGSFDMVITTTMNGKTIDEGNVSWYIGKYEVVIIPKVDGMKSGESKILLNRKKGVMAMLTNVGGQKTGFLMDMESMASTMLSSDGQTGDMTDVNVEVFKSETKIIEGYKCYKVVASDDEFVSESWITEEVDLDMSKLMGYMNMQNSGSSNYQNSFSGISGWPIKTISTDKESGEIHTMEMKNIKKGSVTGDILTTEGYSLMKMPDMGNALKGME